MKTQQRIRKLLVLSPALALALAIALPAAAVDGMFLAGGVSTAQNAKDYYKMIDPANERLTQTAWRIKNGFNDPGNEIVVVQGHQNVSDLGFFRRIEMVVDKRPGYVGNVASTTYNFELGPLEASQSGKTKCCNPKDALSIVNMEYSPGPSGDRITKFYVYYTDNTLTQGANAGLRKDSTVFAAGTGNLYVPNACASCHGGGRDFSVRGGSTGGGWVPFDFTTFKYDLTKTAETQSGNEANVKRLNQAVLMTNPDIPVKTQVRGLYGGKTLPSATQVAYLPADWVTQPTLWDVVARDCEGCHALSAETFLSLNTWKSRARTIRQEVYNIKQMPNSTNGQKNFFGSADDALVNQFLIDNGAPPGTGN